MEKITVCPNCNGTNISGHLSVPDRHYGNKGLFTLSKCKTCRLVFLNPMYDDTELSKFYPQESYYAYTHEQETNQPKGIKLFFAKLIYGKTRAIEVGNGKEILDIGCGNGWTLMRYKAKGWKVSGVEPSALAAKEGNKQGANIFCGNLLEAKFPDKKFDIIRSNHSFEHINNPNETLREIFRILKDDGIILIGIPNIGGINAKIFGKYWYHLAAPVHTFNYSSKNIVQLLKKNGFSTDSIRYVSGASGSLGSLQIYLNRKNGKLSGDGKWIKSKYLQIITSIFARMQNRLRIGDCVEVTAKKILS